MNEINQSPSRIEGPQASQPKQRLSVRLKRVLLWLALGLLGLAALGSLYQILGTALDRRAYSPPGQMIDVGGDEELSAEV